MGPASMAAAGAKNKRQEVYRPEGTKLCKLDAGELDRAADPFCRAVSRFLAIANVIRCLKLKFPLTPAFTSAVHRLLSDAVGGGKVDALRFDIRTASIWMFDSLRHLQLSSADVAVLLGACTRLEHLEMFDCDVPDKALVIHVAPGSAAAAALKELELEFCLYRRVVLRSVPNLARLTVVSWSFFDAGAPLSLGSVPRLESLSVAYCADIRTPTFKLTELLANARNLSQFSLHFENDENAN
ncbi:hypothetical protein E2562_005928 [Oryza meyeriana var. granulata]|uniref:Uncharacterized protein n=1 Tax=Oryza meyeriana var. granulata TaxID=110450 RepID=A0A6G1DV23_9ORYZ|nr:hypothetical protein E2562_005928 [Oryza meyeriana var. granulata]